jgi:hypothetical protein
MIENLKYSKFGMEHLNLKIDCSKFKAEQVNFLNSACKAYSLPLFWIGEQFDNKDKGQKLFGKKKKETTPEEERASSRGHVMISYQWADQQVLKNVRDNIKARGYKVCLQNYNTTGICVNTICHIITKTWNTQSKVWRLPYALIAQLYQIYLKRWSSLCHQY